MNIKNRIEEIEKKAGTQKKTLFIITIYDGQKPTKEAIEKAKKETLEKNPGQNMYVLNLCDNEPSDAPEST